ncbi:MAG: phosphatidylglycerol lysyltransferase [Psychromonas sp.]|jgi:phosphatidylglycerol lysyltransferase|uniref:bifunctional lysylphosphatidylglycerol flippase/synthetase MprF n=1 Tax=Psychromonas sp. TaxID=1884585 RepID=UPI0039E4ECB4
MTEITPNRFASNIKTYGSSLAIFVLFIAGIVILYKTLHQTNTHDIYAQLRALPASKILLSTLFTLLGYTALVGYDWSALKYVGKKLPFPLVAFTSFSGFSLGNTIGVSWLSGGAVRYRLYSRVGLSATEIAMIVAFCTVGFGIGEMLVGGMALIIHPDVFSDYIKIPPVLIRWGAVMIVLSAGLLILIRSYHQGEVHFRGKTFRLPSTGILTGQVLFSILDIGFAGATLFVLLPESNISFFLFLAVFAIALVAGVLSHIPGGIGVFEAVIAGALHPYLPMESLTAALVSYRIIYYLLPFVLGVILILSSEAYIQVKSRWLNTGEQLEESVKLLANVVYSAIPPALSGLTFISGVLMLLGSSIRLSGKTLLMLEALFPAELIEFSHILGGVIGIILIILSFALWQRIRAALWLTSSLFIVGAILSFIQTLDYDRALVLLVALGLLVSSQKLFYRRARLFSSLLDFKWLLLSMAALSGFIWLIFLSFQNTLYNDELWWQFATDQQASRSMRTAVAAVATLLIFYVINALRPPRQVPDFPDQNELALARDIIQQQDNAEGNFALTGDKRLFFSENRKSFIMFASRNRSWVSLGDPVGNDDQDRVSLLWDFKTMVNREQGRAVIYKIATDHLDWYIDAGFNLFKLGEEACIKLADFDLDCPERSKLRQTRNKAIRAGLRLEFIQPPYDETLLETLQSISDQWLMLKKVSEKSFSLGRFDKAYINELPLALVYEEERITAFANVFVTQTKQESTIDLMRHVPDAARDTMDFLFIELMLTLKEQGYGEFSLGMAPLSGFTNHENARLWDRFGTMIYKNGKRFYNFEGLRNFKNKFRPEWVPRYMATTQKGESPFLTLVDIAALTSGGLKRVFKKDKAKSAKLSSGVK